MSNVFFNIDGEELKFELFDEPKNFWKNYHVAKHLIFNSENEKLHEILDISHDEIELIKTTLVKKYKCKVSNKINQKDSCGKCPYTGECNDKLSTMIRIYLDMLLYTLNKKKNFSTPLF